MRNEKARITIQLRDYLPRLKYLEVNLYDTHTRKEFSAKAPIQGATVTLEVDKRDARHFIEARFFDSSDMPIERLHISTDLPASENVFELNPLSGVWALGFRRPFNAHSGNNQLYDHLVVNPLAKVQYDATHEYYLFDSHTKRPTGKGTLCYSILDQGRINVHAHTGIPTTTGSVLSININHRNYPSAVGPLRTLAFPPEIDEALLKSCHFSGEGNFNCMICDFVKDTRSTFEIPDTKSAIDETTAALKKEAGLINAVVDKTLKGQLSAKNVSTVSYFKKCSHSYNPFPLAFDDRIQVSFDIGHIRIYSVNSKRMGG